jgi:hypothetical protein
MRLKSTLDHTDAVTLLALEPRPANPRILTSRHQHLVFGGCIPNMAVHSPSVELRLSATSSGRQSTKRGASSAFMRGITGIQLVHMLTSGLWLISRMAVDDSLLDDERWRAGGGVVQVE